MALSLYAAIGFAAWSTVDDPWYGRVLDDTYFMATVFILGIATMLAVLRHGRNRAIWLGFAVFGWVHLNFGWPDSGGAPQRARIVTGAGWDGTYRPRFPHTTLIGKYLIESTTAGVGSNPLKLDYNWHVLQSTMTMATALVGAVIGNFLFRRGERLEGDSGAGDGSTGGGDRPSDSSSP
jgi:hypothetical protein